MSDVKTYTMEEVGQHNTADDLWIVYNDQVYDVSKYLDEHPGGEEVILDCAGTNATEAFNDIGHSDDAHEILEGLLLGKLEGAVTLAHKGVISSKSSPEVSGMPAPVLLLVVAVVAVGVYYYVM